MPLGCCGVCVYFNQKKYLCEADRFVIVDLLNGETEARKCCVEVDEDMMACEDFERKLGCNVCLFYTDEICELGYQ